MILVIIVLSRVLCIWINLNTMGLCRLSIIICNISKSSPLIVSVLDELLSNHWKELRETSKIFMVMVRVDPLDYKYFDQNSIERDPRPGSWY